MGDLSGPYFTPLVSTDITVKIPKKLINPSSMSTGVLMMGQSMIRSAVDEAEAVELLERMTMEKRLKGSTPIKPLTGSIRLQAQESGEYDMSLFKSYLTYLQENPGSHIYKDGQGFV